ncbi:MAG TPA: hypothetical protein VGL38_08625 [bacterium]|jgi:predicted membrane-bound spermidine synthase
MNTLLLAAVLLFPTVHGRSVMQRHVALPSDLAGRPTIVLITFGQDQQIMADSWLPLFGQIQTEYPAVGYREVSVSNFNDRLTRCTVDAYNNFSTQDPAVYENTVVLSAGRSRFLRDLHLPNDHTTYTLLLDAAGFVRWRAAGTMTPLNGQRLKEAVGELSEKSKS